MEILILSKDFIGSTFKTPSGGILTVKASYVNETLRKRFICECSICSKDTELWPYGSINAPKYNIKNGNVPCGCSKPKWKEWQWLIKVKRHCSKQGYKFLGWDGEFIGDKTKVCLFNPSTGNTWKSTSAGKLLSGQGDPKTPHHLLQRKPDEYYVKMFMDSGKFPKGTVFKRDNVTKDKFDCYSYWDVECPVCKEDIFSSNGFPYIFKASNTSLRDGALPCRCYKGYTKTEAEMRFILENICEEEGHVFKDFTNDYTTVKETSVDWVCSEGHNCKTNLYDFTKGVRCRACYDNIPKTQNGYYRTRTEEDDWLYVLKFTRECDQFIKVGRTFVKTVRPRELDLLCKTNSKRVECLLRLKSNHDRVWNLEQKVLDYFKRDYRYFHNAEFKGSSECLAISCLSEVITTLKTEIEGDSNFTIVEDNYDK